MKKYIVLALALILGFISFGCQQTQGTTSGTVAVPSAVVASNASILAGMGTSIDNTILGWCGTGALAVKIQAPTGSYASGWWHVTDAWETTGVSYDYDSYFRVYDALGEVITSAGLDGVSESTFKKVVTYTTLAYSMAISSETYAYNIKYGNSKDDPYTYDKENSKVDGPITLTTSSGGYGTYSMTMDYNNLSVGTSGYPTGTVAITVTSGGVTQTGSIVYNGTNIATMTWGSDTYTINLDTD